MLISGLKAAFRQGSLEFCGNLAPLAEPSTFATWIRLLFRNDWVVYSKQPFGGPEHALRYLGAYTHRVAISNHRLVALAGNNVTFRWRDSAHSNKKRLMTLPVDEFLRRFLLHLRSAGAPNWIARAFDRDRPAVLDQRLPPHRVSSKLAVIGYRSQANRRTRHRSCS